MSSTRESIAQSVRGELEALIGQVSQVEGTLPSIRDTEEQGWTGVLALGRQLMQWRFEACSAAETIYDTLEVDDVEYSYQRHSRRVYVSLFGEVRVARAYYWHTAQGGVCPLDGVLSLPERCYSDSVQERLSEMNVWVPQGQALQLVDRWLGLAIPKRSLQHSAQEQAIVLLNDL
jgi:hypothetical protein